MSHVFSNRLKLEINSDQMVDLVFMLLGTQTIVSLRLARRLVLPMLLTNLLFFCLGQSRYVDSLSNGGRTQITSTRLPEAPEDSLNPAGQTITPQYTLVFPSNYDGKIHWKFSDYDQMVRSQRRSFIDRMNKAGERGYRFVSGLRSTPYAVLKLDEGTYEYDLFETTGSVHFAKNRLEEKLAETGETGFRVAEHSVISQSCEIEDLTASILNEKCTYKDLFLLERERSPKRRVNQIVIRTLPGWGAEPSVEMASLINEKLAEGYYPIRAISRFEILLERAKDKDDIVKVRPDVQVVRSSWGTNNVQEKVNELATKGYRLATASNGIAIMYRNNETRSVPVVYAWLRADKRNFEKELAKLQAKGVVYRTIYPSEKGTKNTLIFEQNLGERNKGAEFKILSFEFNSVEDKTKGKVSIDLTPSSKEAVNKMNQLAKEGFEVRDLFDSGKVSVILERNK